MSVSKLFTPKLGEAPQDCFVSPPTAPTVTDGFADAEGGGAMYPLKLRGDSGAGDKPRFQKTTIANNEYDEGL